MCLRELATQLYVQEAAGNLNFHTSCDLSSMNSKTKFSYSLDSTIRRKLGAEVLYLESTGRLKLITNDSYVSASSSVEHGQFYFIFGKPLTWNHLFVYLSL